MNQTHTWRRQTEEYEADLYRDQTVKFLGFSFHNRARGGEIEVKKYDNGENRVEIKFFGVEVPDGSMVSATADGKIICEVEVRQGVGRLQVDIQGEAVSAVRNGSKADIRYMGRILMEGTFKPD